MAEERRKKHLVLLDKNGKTISMQLFEANLWPAQSSTEGLYRVRIDGKWHCPAGKYTFLSFSAVANLAEKILNNDQEPIKFNSPPANLSAKQRVRVHYGECIDGMPVNSAIAWTASPPFQGIDGRWRIFVLMAGEGIQEFFCDDVEIV